MSLNSVAHANLQYGDPSPMKVRAFSSAINLESPCAGW
jgi:hypothetical protein